jgi:hypothetical protein
MLIALGIAPVFFPPFAARAAFWPLKSFAVFFRHLACVIEFSKESWPNSPALLERQKYC